MTELTQVIGYLAAALGLAAFAMKGLLSLRALAAAMNVAFAVYGWLAGNPLLMWANVALVPLNLFRLVELWQTKRRAAGLVTTEVLSIDPLLPFMLEIKRAKGTCLFAKGDPAEIMFYIAKGQIRIVEPDRVCRSGDLIGEIALFAPDGRRTATAICETDCVLYALTGKKATELYLEHPAFGLHLVRLITSRLIDGAAAASATPVHSRLSA
jgi:hypothetical protein